MGTPSWQSNMAVGVHQDRGLSIPMRSMVNLTSVRMAKEDPGQMTSTGFQVCLNWNSLGFGRNTRPLSVPSLNEDIKETITATSLFVP